MAQFSQENAAFQIQTPLGPDALVVLSFQGTECLSGLFEFRLQLGALAGSRVPFEALLGQCATVSLQSRGQVQRYISGVICQFTAKNSDRYLDHYEMVLRPRLWQLGLVKQSRIFQQQNACQILSAVLAPVGGASQLVAPTPATRVYCTQYRETDLEFFNRICFEQGLASYWVHSASDHLLKITNMTPNNPSLGTCKFNQAEGGWQDNPSIKTWETTQTLVNNQLSLRDSQFQLFNQPLTAQGKGQQTAQAGTVTLKVSSSAQPWQENGASPGRYFDTILATGQENSGAMSDTYEYLQTRANILSTAIACKAVLANGSGNCMNLVAGYRFTLADHPTADGAWLVTRLEHEGKQEGLFWSGEAAKVSYSNRFEAVPASSYQKPWPPVPRPKVGGVQTAIVIGPEGQEMNIDPFGRVQVRFWWDAAESTTSCWVRVAQVWAGNSWGACFWPRVGHEVVVSFEDGDPDRPLIVGSVYNSTNMPPYPLPANQYIAGWKSLTEGGDPSKNYHQILISDEKGAEVVHIHAESSFIVNQESIKISSRPSFSVDQQG